MVDLFLYAQGESQDLGVVIERDISRGITVAELYEDGAFHKHGIYTRGHHGVIRPVHYSAGGVGIGDEILMLDGVPVLGKTLDEAREMLRNAFRSSTKVTKPHQLSS